MARMPRELPTVRCSTRGGRAQSPTVRFAAQIRTSRDREVVPPAVFGEQTLLPEIIPGTVYSVPAHRTTNDRAGWCVRLFGRSLTDGVPVFGFTQGGDYTELVYLSASFIQDRCSRVGWDAIPPDAAAVLSDCFSHPPVHCSRAVATDELRP